MKALRYLLMVIALLSVMSASAHTFDKQWGQKPVIEMHSTSAMAYSGSTLPQAAATGVSLASAPQQAAPVYTRSVRRERPGDWTNPYDDPLGDVLWPLMLMALAYVVYLKTRKKKENI